MGKEKKMYLEQNKKELTFYYELIGVGTILLSLIALARLGFVGYYLMMTFRIIFGDWYFVFLLALLLFGIYCLFKHQPLNMLNMRSIGIILLMIALLTLSHFPMHKYVSNFGKNYLKMTFGLYLDYFKNYEEGMIVGGGIIGMLFFYLFYSLFSSVGTIVIIVFLSVVGISFSFNKTIGETFGFVKKIFVKLWNILRNIKKTIKYGIKVDSKEKKVVKKNTPKLSIDMLDEPIRQNFIITEEKHALSLKKTIGNILNNMNVFYQDITYVIAEHVTTCKIDTIANINLDKLYMRLKAILTERFLITKDIDSPKIKIEIDNIDTNSVYLKTILQEQKSYMNNLKLGIGIDTENELVEMDFSKNHNVLLIEKNMDLVTKIMDGYLLMLKIKLSKISCDYIYLDCLKIHKQLNKWEYYYQDIKSCLNKIKQDVDQRLDLLNQNNCQDIEEYNKKYHGNLDIKFVFILNLEVIMKEKDDLNTLLYLLQVASICGYNFIIHYSDEEVLNSSIDSLFNIKILGKNSTCSSNHYIGIDPSNYLYEDEAFYLCKDELFRFSLVKARSEESKKIINY